VVGSLYPNVIGIYTAHRKDFVHLAGGVLETGREDRKEMNQKHYAYLRLGAEGSGLILLRIARSRLNRSESTVGEEDEDLA